MEFDVQKTIAYWLEGAEYDIGVAVAMLEKVAVAFMRQGCDESHPYNSFYGVLS